MKLFFKQFFRTISLVMFVLALFGSMLLYSSFRMSLEEELKRMSGQVGMFTYALNSSLAGLPGEYEAVDYAAAQIAESIVKSGSDSDEIVRIYNSNAGEIYISKKDFIKKADEADFSNTDPHYEIFSYEGKKYLQTFSLMRSDRGKYYLEISRDITSIYENRAGLYRQYILVLAVGIFLSALLSMFFSFSFTRPLLVLSKTTRKFADGDYETRVEIKGDDEISLLMADFNEMADRLTDNINKLEYQAKAQEEFTAAFAHELKTPLTSIVGYSDMLRSMQLGEEDIRVCGNYIFNQGSRLEKLSYKLLELVGMDKGTIDFKQITVSHIMDSVSKMMKKSMEDKHIRFEIDFTEAQINGDEDLIISLICNLLDNSRKACADYGGEIFLGGMADEAFYVIKVRDNGCGIPEEELDKIKEAFYMVDKSRARRDGGAGIGMALCEKIISLHNAKWKIRSSLTEGTEIEIRFPIFVEEKSEK